MTTETEPGWVEENQLAERLGWECLKDGLRGGPDTHWCRFVKGDNWVWKIRPRGNAEWMRAILIDGTYCQHKGYLTLERALRGEG